MHWPHSGCSVSTCGFGNCEGHEPRTFHSGGNAAGCCCSAQPGLAGTDQGCQSCGLEHTARFVRGLNLNSWDNRQICGRCVMVAEVDTHACLQKRWRSRLQRGPGPAITFLLLHIFVSLLKFSGLQLFSFSKCYDFVLLPRSWHSKEMAMLSENLMRGTVLIF